MRKLLGLLVLFVAVFNLLSVAFIVYRTQSALQTATAHATGTRAGEVAFCLNQQPVFTIPCNTTLTQYDLFTCQLNVTDSPGSSVLYRQVVQPPDNATVFNITPTGLINFTPREDDVGNHSVLIAVDDGTGCLNALASSFFSYRVLNVNDPPYLVRLIPPQTFAANTTLFAFNLRDYFIDPDKGDILSFRYLLSASDVGVNVTINPDSSVVFTGTRCGKARFIFIATDLGNLSASSNVVTVEVNCQTHSPGDGNVGSGSGSGGGGGSSSICEPELVCLPWSDCYPNGLQVQLCQDKNGCSDDQAKFYRNCTYEGEQPRCKENWLCSEWGVCTMAGRQNRTCEDLSECETTQFLPALDQECLYKPRCDDGVQNGNETGIDCGAECAPCKTIQQPAFFPEARSLATLLTFLVILLLLVLLALFTLYRERVYEGLARLGWLLAPHKEKELLLSPAEKRTLFEDLALLEKELPALTPQKTYERLGVILRKYYSFVFDVPFEYTPEEYGAALAAAKLSDDLRALLAGFSARLDLLESSVLADAPLNDLLFLSVKEELRLMVCMTSLYGMDEVSRELSERVVTQELSFEEEIRTRLLNAYEALQFCRVEVAELEYVAILRAYENLPVAHKALVYADVQRLFLAVRYVAETMPDA